MPQLSNFSEVISNLCASADDREVPKLLYSRKDAAYAISISTRALDILIGTNQLAVRRIGKKVLVVGSSLAEYASADHATLSRPAFETVQ